MKIPELSPKNGQGRAEAYRRREFLAFGAGLGATFLAGCATQTDSIPASTDVESTDRAAGSTDSTGTFRLLVSDQPTAIGDFDRLDVSLSHARVFHAESGSEDTEETETEEPTDTERETETETEEVAETDTPENEDDEGDGEEEQPEQGQGESEDDNGGNQEGGQDSGDDGEERGFFEIDLDGATVDLTQVVGEKAIEVFDGELQAGRYAKLELHVADVEGIVAGDQVNVKVPSEKLQIVKPFEVVPGETLSFVFDINVVKKGQTGEYNLLPVISKSGVAGEDVAVEEVKPGDPDQSETEANGNESAGGPPDDAGGDA